MAVEYPPGWAGLARPEWRGALLETLRALSDEAYQRSHWLDASAGSGLVEGIDEVFHFFFDDTDLAEPSGQRVGEVFLDADEARAVSAVIARLEVLLEALGEADSAAFLRHPGWPGLMALAKAAFERLSRVGLPSYPG